MKLTAYQTVPPEGYGLAPAPHGRGWMDATAERSAYRCLPLLIANQAGWVIANPATVRVKWDGGPNLAAIEVQRWERGDAAGQDYLYPSSHFGVGIITWTLPYLFRTPPGYNLLVRGPANSPKDGVAPLEGITETDWTPATFTMNWQITRPHTWVTFDEGEPLCMIVPQRRGELEEFVPEILPLADNPELRSSNAQWGQSRDQFTEDRQVPGTDAAKKGWQKDYFRSSVQNRLRLHSFTALHGE